LTMRPGQLKPNDFEVAILECISSREPSLIASAARLHVLSREYTGVGSYTRFLISEPSDDAIKQQVVDLGALINMPGVQHGMGATLFLRAGEPECLEVFTYGEEHWDGTYDGFYIEPTVS
jgi:hypothetical protein